MRAIGYVDGDVFGHLEQIKIGFNCQLVIGHAVLRLDAINGHIERLVLGIGHSNVDGAHLEDVCRASRSVESSVGCLDGQLALVQSELVVVVVAALHRVNAFTVIVEECAVGHCRRTGQHPQLDGHLAKVGAVQGLWKSVFGHHWQNGLCFEEKRSRRFFVGEFNLSCWRYFGDKIARKLVPLSVFRNVRLDASLML